MGALTVRKISDEVHAALKDRARQNGRSTEAEVRAIIESSLGLAAKKGMGTALEEIGKAVGGIDLDITRDKTPARFAVFD